MRINALWMLLIVSGLIVGAAPGLDAGSIQYPALGNFDVRQGTIELWLTPTRDLRPEVAPGGYQSILSLFHLKVPHRFTMGASWYAKATRDGARYRLHASIGHAEHRAALMPVPAEAVDWQRGQRHHVAFTWDGRTMKLYADGELVGQRQQAKRFRGPLGGCHLRIGDRWGKDAGYILHAVRISRTAHAAKTQQDARPVPRLDTLLLDRFADETFSGGDKHTTRAEIIAGLTGETGGTVHGQHHLTTQPHPGLALYKKGARQGE